MASLLRHTQSRYFNVGYSEDDLSTWVAEFAKNFRCSLASYDNAIRNAKKELKEEFDKNAISVCLMICTDGEIVKTECNKVSLVQMERERRMERNKFDNLLQEHSELKFMKSGRAGRMHFDVIPSKFEEGRSTVEFRELERAPIIDLNKGLFRRSFPLSVDYKLLGDTELSGDSPKEDLLLFANRHLIDRNPLEAVVSLFIGDKCGATAFYVSPNGGLITCYHNLSTEDHGPIVDLKIHRSVVSNSLTYADTEAEKVTFVPCALPMLDGNAKDPIDASASLRVSLEHSDIAFLRSSPVKAFLIPYAMDLPIGEAIVCIGYPREVSLDVILSMYRDIYPQQAPEKSDFEKLFTFGHLSISAGPLLGYNTSALACKIATTPGFSGSPVCLLTNPRKFSGIHYRGRHGKDHALSVSVRDPGFYHLYSTLVVPELRDAGLCQEDIDAINKYLSIGVTPLITSKKRDQNQVFWREMFMYRTKLYNYTLFKCNYFWTNFKTL
jgi:V8-like Glu-specific endopeptidase